MNTFSTSYWAKAFSGKFEYFKPDGIYAEESFEVLVHTHNRQYLYKSYLTTRADTGELFKIFTEYQLHESFIPIKVEIIKQVGGWEASEEFLFDLRTNTLNYTFKNKEEKKEQVLNLFKRFVIQTPSGICNALFSLHKKIDVTSRQPISMITTPNKVSWTGSMKENTMYISYLIKEGQNFLINGCSYQFLHCEIFAKDPNEGINEIPIEMKISKKFALPFEIKFDNKHYVKLIQLTTSPNLGVYDL